MSRRFNFRTCGLGADKYDLSHHKPCYGEISTVSGVKLCQRHKDLLEAIRKDANSEGRRHPIHHGRAA